MPEMLRKSLASVMVICLLVLAGLVYPQVVPHEAHHAHHGAIDHGTALCAWLCAAGQALEGAQVVMESRLAPASIVSAATAEVLRLAPLLSSLSRGPPLSFQ
jgi:hypothetical protein